MEALYEKIVASLNLEIPEPYNSATVRIDELTRVYQIYKIGERLEYILKYDADIYHIDSDNDGSFTLEFFKTLKPLSIDSHYSSSRIVPLYRLD